MKNSEIIQLTNKELIERMDEEKAILTKLKLNHAVSPLDNPHKISNSRRNIARMKTEIRQREMSGTLNNE
ncbi:MAG: 50S ribosomal protein L29 [Bacteroidales bacterium]|nr:50S ribosomal protein L29 [Bacteroidales bacterium]MCF8454872.1 50S ribosomal protein L29 [Bacteroidales bacterium]